MRVLVTTGLYPPEIGGPATYSKLLEEGLPQHGVSVVVLPYRTVRKYWSGVRHFVYAYRVWKASRGAEVLYAQDTASVGLPTVLANLFLWKKIIVRVPGDHAWEQGTQRFGITEQLDTFPRWSWSWHPWLMLIRLSQFMVVWSARKIVVPSKYLARVVESWGVDPKKIVVIYNGVSLSDVGKRETIRGLLHFNGKLLISVGRLVPWKGFDVVIKVFAKLYKKFPDMKLFIVGTGPEEAKLVALTESLGIVDQVIFAGAVDHDALMRYLRASDVLVLNTAYEGLSHLVLEACAVGVPVVTTEVGGNVEVITDGVDGYLIKPNDQSAMQSRITTLFEKSAVREKIIANEIKRAGQFTDEKVIQETAALLKKP